MDGSPEKAEDRVGERPRVRRETLDGEILRMWIESESITTTCIYMRGKGCKSAWGG